MAIGNLKDLRNLRQNIEVAMNRLQILQGNLKTLDLDGILITNPENRRYLSGFTGSAGVLFISASQAFIVTDFRYWEQVTREVKGFVLQKQGPKLWESVNDLVQALQWKQIGFEAGSLTFQEYQTLCNSFPANLKLIPTTDLVEKQRWVKEEAEIELITQAAKITDQALAKTLTIIKSGIKEREIALEFDYQLRVNGAEGNAFRTIVISGKRSALPHGAASEKSVVPGDFILIDGGALYQGYHADMTRTYVLGTASSEQKRVYQIVLKAQEKALEYLKAGLPGNIVDRVAREFLAEQGFGDNFGHGLGHCVGLNIHENPRLSPIEQNQIPTGAVITVEPGVYLPDWGGVRIEDLVVVEANGIRNLTKSPKQDLIEL